MANIRRGGTANDYLRSNWTRDIGGANYVHHIHQDMARARGISGVNDRLRKSKWQTAKSQLQGLINRQKERELKVLNAIIGTAPDWEDLVIAAFGNNPPTDANGNLLTNAEIEAFGSQYTRALARARGSRGSVDSGVVFLNALITFELHTQVPFTDDADSLGEARQIAEGVIYNAMSGVSGQSYANKNFSQMTPTEQVAFVKALGKAVELIQQEYSDAADAAGDNPVRQFVAHLLSRGLRYLAEQYQSYKSRLGAEDNSELAKKHKFVDVSAFQGALRRAGLTLRTGSARGAKSAEKTRMNRTAEQVFTQGAINSLKSTEYSIKGRLSEIIGSEIAKSVIEQFGRIEGMSYTGGARINGSIGELNRINPDYSLDMNISVGSSGSSSSQVAVADLDFGVSVGNAKGAVTLTSGNIGDLRMSLDNMNALGGIAGDFSFLYDREVSYVLVNALFHDWTDIIKSFEEAMESVGYAYLGQQLSDDMNSLSITGADFMFSGGRLVAMSQILEKMYDSISQNERQMVEARISRVPPNLYELRGYKMAYASKNYPPHYYSPGWIHNVAANYGDKYLGRHSITLVFRDELIRGLI